MCCFTDSLARCRLQIAVDLLQHQSVELQNKIEVPGLTHPT